MKNLPIFVTVQLLLFVLMFPVGEKQFLSLIGIPLCHFGCCNKFDKTFHNAVPSHNQNNCLFFET